MLRTLFNLQLYLLHAFLTLQRRCILVLSSFCCSCRILRRLTRTYLWLLPVFHCCRSNKLCVASACNASCSCITSNFAVDYIQFRSGAARACHRSFPKALVGKRVCPPHIVFCIIHLSGGSSSSRDTRRRRDGVKLLSCLPFPLEAKERKEVS